MNQLNVAKVGNAAGVVAIAFFLLCMAWGAILSDPVLKELHLNLLRIAYPWFAMNIAGAAVGAAESFVYGWVFGALFSWLHNRFIKNA